MGKVVDEFPERPYVPVGRKEKYPYDKWFNGQIWELIGGTDFSNDPENFRITLTGAARRRNTRIRTRVVGSRVYVQAYQNNVIDLGKRSSPTSHGKSSAT